MRKIPLETNIQNLRIIKTARDKNSINQAAKSGFFPLVKIVKKSELISSKFAISQHEETGEIQVLNDFRFGSGGKGYKKIIDYTSYYPYSFPSPYAAYLIPKDIEIGEHVFIEDLIEDLVGASWNQGDKYRLESCEAIWNGEDFDIQYNPEENIKNFMG